MDQLIRSCVLVVLTVGGCAAGLGAARLQAQDVSAHQLAAAYLVNFVKYTSWPFDALSDGTTIVVCVAGNGLVADALGQLTQNHPINGHPLTVRRATLDGPLDGCHVIYAAEPDRNRAARLIQTTSRLPILTVSDATDFAEHGGIANFFLDNGRLRFAVNAGAASRARMQISSKLLSLAKIVGP
ncbi:MAG: YfiR family protein [Vicinamibacterales bacterium]